MHFFQDVFQMTAIVLVSVINHYHINGLHLFWDTLYANLSMVILCLEVRESPPLYVLIHIFFVVSWKFFSAHGPMEWRPGSNGNEINWSPAIRCSLVSYTEYPFLGRDWFFFYPSAEDTFSEINDFEPRIVLTLTQSSWPSQLGLENTPTVSLQKSKHPPPTSVLDMTKTIW